MKPTTKEAKLLLWGLGMDFTEVNVGKALLALTRFLDQRRPPERKRTAGEELLDRICAEDAEKLIAIFDNQIAMFAASESS